MQPVTPLKYPSKNTTSPDMEDIEILNLDKVISKKQLRLRNRNKRNKDSNYDDDDSSGSSEEEEDNDEDTRAEEKSNNSIAEPIMAPLRRARDELNDGSMSKRTSIDDLLHIQGSSSFKDEPGSPVLDLKAEKAIRESYHNNIVAEAKPLINTSNVSKPPRPPNPKPPYAQKAKNQAVDNSGIASSIVDKSFVNEDWDESSPEKNKLKQTKNVQGGGPGVQADANWLDEDFDD